MNVSSYAEACEDVDLSSLKFRRAAFNEKYF